jgi:hypothetical protein
MANANILLKELIMIREAEHEAERKLLKQHFDKTHESLKLTNILSSTLKNAFAAPELKRSVINAGIAIATGFVVKKIFKGTTTNPLIKLLSSVI